MGKYLHVRQVKRRNKFTTFLKSNYVGWLFNLPLMIGLLVFTCIPMCLSLYYSFFDLSVKADGLVGEFVGLGQYIRIFQDEEMGPVVLNTLLFAIISVPLNLVLSYFLALLVNTKFKFTKFFRVIYYLPVIIPAVVNGFLWKDLTDSTFGIFNKILNMIGLDNFPFFQSAKTALFSLILMNVWSVGGGMVLWLSAFKNIPKPLYEAARIEGANAFQRFYKITLPLSTPIIFYNAVMSIIGTLQFNGTLTIGINNGKGIDNSLYLYGVKVWFEAFKSGDIGYGAALSWLLFIVIGILTFIMFSTSKWVYYQED